MKYLYAAYVATWLIHGGYLCTLAIRYSRLKREMKDFKARP